MLTQENKKQTKKTNKAFQVHAVSTCQIRAIPFAFNVRCLWQATHTGGKKKKRRVHKENGRSRTGLNGGGKGLCACALKLQHGSSSPLTSLLNWLLPAGLAVPVCCCPQRFIVSYSGVCSPTTGGPREENGCLNISTFM